MKTNRHVIQYHYACEKMIEELTWPSRVLTLEESCELGKCLMIMRELIMNLYFKLQKDEVQ